MNSVASQFLRFGAVGVVGTACHYVVLIALVQGGGSGPVLASTLGAMVGALVNYVLNRRLTFASDRPHREALPRFMTVAAAGFVLNAVIMKILTDWPLHYVFAQVVATIAVLVFNFLANRWWTFRKINH
jgi:putative flippase GtrA